MTALPLGLVPERNPSPGMYDYGLLDDETVPVKAGDVPARVRERDLVDLVRVQPDLALSAF